MKRLAVLAAAVLSATAAGAFAADKSPTAPRVLVIPFSVLNVPESQQWIGKGVQENLIADLGRSGAYSPLAFQGQVVVEDNATAVRLAKNAGASMVIRGTAQMVGDQVRVTAQMIDAGNGETVRSGSVTGTTGDLLKLEDQLSAQLVARNDQGAASATTSVTAVAPTPQNGGSSYVGAVPTPTAVPGYYPVGFPVYYAQPVPVYYPDYNNYYSSYGYLGYNPYYYPFFGTTIFFTTGHGHDHDHDGDHGHSGGGGGGGHDGHNGGGPGGGSHGGGGSSGGGPVVHGPPAGFNNPTALPIMTTNMLPTPTSGAGLPILRSGGVPVSSPMSAPRAGGGGASGGGFTPHAGGFTAHPGGIDGGGGR